MKTLTIIQEDNESVSETVLSFAIEFKDILLQISKYGNWCTASQLVDLLTDKSSDLNILRRYIKSVADCEEVTTRNTSELIQDGAFCRVLMRGSIAKKDSCGTVYVKDFTEVLLKRLEFCGTVDMVSRPGRGNPILKAVF